MVLAKGLFIYFEGTAHKRRINNPA
jgi:hypothetical protein